jgi:hypothetical protein
LSAAWLIVVGAGAVGDVVVIPRVARYKAPSTLGKLRDITTAILPQVFYNKQPKPLRELKCDRLLSS